MEEYQRTFIELATNRYWSFFPRVLLASFGDLSAAIEKCRNRFATKFSPLDCQAIRQFAGSILTKEKINEYILRRRRCTRIVLGVKFKRPRVRLRPCWLVDHKEKSSRIAGDLVRRGSLKKVFGDVDMSIGSSNRMIGCCACRLSW